VDNWRRCDVTVTMIATLLLRDKNGGRVRKERKALAKITSIPLKMTAELHQSGGASSSIIIIHSKCRTCSMLTQGEEADCAEWAQNLAKD